jgi:hypothetical protein
MTELTHEQEVALDYLAERYVGVAVSGPDATGTARLEAYNDEPDLDPNGNVKIATARWIVHANGYVVAAWDPDHLVEPYEVERQAREEYS